MRTLKIDLTKVGSEMYPDGQTAGVRGEHCATCLEVTLSEVLTLGASFHHITFRTGDSVVYSGIIGETGMTQDGNCRYEDGKIYIMLWQALTDYATMTFTISAYTMTGSDLSLLARSPLIGQLYFTPAAANPVQAPEQGLVVDIAGLEAAKHTHANKTTLDKLSESGGLLEFDGSPIGDSYFVSEFSDLPASAPTGTRRRVLSDGAQLTLGEYSSLIFNTDIPSVPLLFSGAKSVGLYANTDPFTDGDCIVFSPGQDDSGSVYLYIYVEQGANSFNYYSRDITLSSVSFTAGWHNASDDSACAAPTLTNFTVARISHDSNQYVSTDTLPAAVLSALSSVSLVVNTAADEMHSKGEYVYDGTAWTLLRSDDELELYTGTLQANRRYYGTVSEDLTVTLPAASALDLSRDNSILFYINLSYDIDLTLNDTDVLCYDSSLPDTSAGYHELIFTFNVLAGKWQVGALGAGVVS